MSDEQDRATVEDLEKAKADAQRWDDAWANDASNNPDKFHSQRQEARERVRLLIRQLKLQGDLPVSAEEALAFELERLHPKARHGDTVEHRGGRYRRHCTPARMSRQGNPISWDCTWVAA